jgi:thiol-disulfide isomerase/thioredoxin
MNTPRYCSVLRGLVLLAVSGLLACTQAGMARVPQRDAAEGKPLPTFPLRDLWTGQPMSLSDLNQQGLILDVWASWCEPCREELPVLNELAGRLRPRGLAVVAVSIDADESAARELLAQNKTWKLRVAHDPQGLVPQALQLRTMPSTYVVDKSGVVRHVLAGFARGELEKLERELGTWGQP